MKHHNFIFLFLFLINMTALAQDTTARGRQMERAILMTEDTDIQVLAKGRKLLLDCINQDSISKAAEVMKYLDERFAPTRVMPFWPAEREIIALWTRQYDFLLKTENLEPPPDDGFRQRIVPPRDLLAIELQQKAIREKVALLAGILSSTLSDEEKQFLEVFVATWIVDRRNPRTAQDSINTVADLFLSEYPRSRFVPYIRTYIRFVYSPSEWSYGYDLSFGTIGLREYISTLFNDATTLGLGFDVTYRKFAFYPRIAVGFGSSVKKTFDHVGTWNEGLPIEIMIPELSVGYLFVENRFIRVTPFAGIAGILIAPPETEKNKPGNDVMLNSDASFIYGLNIDLRLGAYGSPFIGPTNDYSGWIIKMRVGMTTPSYTGTNSAFSGSTFYITLGIGGTNRPIKRDE